MSYLLKCRVLVRVALSSALSLLLLAICGVTRALAADEAATPTSNPTPTVNALKAAHDELRAWLNESENGRGWLRYLDADQLERQIALGDRADKSVVQRISARYAEQHAGLELPDFRAVAVPLQAWLADLSLPSRAELPAALRAGATSLKRPTADQLSEARQGTRSQMDQLSEFLGDGADAQGWKQYLRWNDLTANTEGRRADIKTLREIRGLLAARHAGLDLAQFVNVRLALESYIARLSLLEKDAAGIFNRQLEMLATAIERGDSARPEGRKQMSQGVCWLTQHEQAPELVRAVRRHFPQLESTSEAVAVAPPPTPTVRLMSPSKEHNLRKLLPRVDDEALRRVLGDPSLILYTEDEMPRTYQIWDGQLQGVHLASYNISANRSEPYGNGNHEFPWGGPAGTHRAREVSSFRFVWLPRDERGQLRPIVWYRQQLAGDSSSSYIWSFPVGSVVGEVLTIQDPDGYSHTFEMRLRFRKSDRWGVDVFRPFPTAEDLARRIRELRPSAERQPKLAELLAHLEQPQSLPWRHLSDEQPGRRVFAEWAGVDKLPATGDDALVKELLATTFTSCLDQTWRVGSNGAWAYAATTEAAFHVVPVNYDAGFVEVSGRSCVRCHSTCNEHVSRFNFGRDWYGHVRGSDGIFSFHPFEPGTVSGNGFSSGVQMRQELVQAGVLESYDSQKHSASVYTTVPGL